MNNKKLTLIWGFGIGILSVFLFKIELFPLLFKMTKSAGWSYVIDQGIPFVVAVISTIYFFRKKLNFGYILRRVNPHLLNIFILEIAILFVHGLLLNSFFYAEDSGLILKPILHNNNLPPINRGYPFMPFILSSLLFKVEILPFNIVSLILFSSVIIFTYWFIYILSNNKFISLISSLFLATTPVFLAMFTWTALAQGTPFTIFLSLLSLIFLIYFQKSKSKTYYLLSLLFFLASVKVGFVRSAGMIFIFLFLLFLPNLNQFKSRSYSFLLGIPYLIVWIGFFLVNSFYPRGDIGIGGFNLSKYLAGVAYYLSGLFLPTLLAKQIFAFLKSLFAENISMVLIIGYTLGFFLAVLLIISIFRRKFLTSWLIILGIVFIFSNLFYIPIFQEGIGDISKLDLIFSKTSPPYGPGSRYLFPSSLGVGVLFAVFIWWLGKKNKLLNILSMTVLIITISINGYLSLKSHRDFINGEIRLTKALVENVFSMVPRDGRPKLLLSANSLYKNQIDTNHGGRDWLHGFYKDSELIYTNDLAEIKELVGAKRYGKEDLYGFYYNPETGSFADVSFLARDVLFNNQEGCDNKGKNILFSLSDSKTEMMPLVLDNEENVFVANRPILASEDISERVMSQKTLSAGIEASLIDLSFPFTDAVIRKKPRLIPVDLWEKIAFNGPLITKTENKLISALSKDILANKILQEDKLNIITVVGDRENLRMRLEVSVSNMDEGDNRVNKASLIDGAFNSEPFPSKYDTFYLSKTMPVEIDFKLPYPIVLGRLLLNTVKSFISDNAPLEANILSSLDGGFYEEVGSLTKTVDNNWSPNNGKMIAIPLKQVMSDYVKLIVNKTNTGSVSFDEIIIDDTNALNYSPEQIYNYSNKAFWYVDSQDILDRLLTIGSYYKLNLIYACAEDKDWENQNKHPESLVPEVWNIETLSFDLLSEWTNTSTPIDCYGSMLRKIFIIGPPFPARLQIRDAIIN